MAVAKGKGNEYKDKREINYLIGAVFLLPWGLYEWHLLITLKYTTKYIRFLKIELGSSVLFEKIMNEKTIVLKWYNFLPLVVSDQK